MANFNCFNPRDSCRGCLHNQPEIKDSIVNNVLTPLGKIFISLIKMIVIPIVFSTLILGIAGVGSTKV